MFLIITCGESNFIVEYCDTVVAPAQIILLLKMLKFPKHSFLKEKFFVKGKKWESFGLFLEYYFFLNGTPKLN
jgi:hypothetical protein